MHYRFFKRRFHIDLWWLWVVQAVLYVGVIAAYAIIPGKEIVYAIYIPLDILLTMSLAFFYYLTYIDTKKEEELEA